MGDPARLLEVETADRGGIAQAGQRYHDLGPHKIFTLDQALLRRVVNILPEGSWLEQKKTSAIFMKGRFLPYPPSPTSLIGVYGLSKVSWMAVQYFIALLASLFPRGFLLAQSLVAPFLLAAFFAIIFSPPLYWLQNKGVPGVVERTLIRPPSSRLGPCDAMVRAQALLDDR